MAPLLLAVAGGYRGDRPETTMTPTAHLHAGVSLRATNHTVPARQRPSADKEFEVSSQVCVFSTLRAWLAAKASRDFTHPAPTRRPPALVRDVGCDRCPGNEDAPDRRYRRFGR